LVQQLILAIFYEHCVQRSKMIGRGNMMNLQRSLYLAGCAGLALTCPNIARAQAAQAPTADQNTAAQADREPDEIVVTANKREQNLNDVGLSVTAISGEALAERRVTSVQDIAAAIPGLKFAESGTNTPIYTLRGIGFNEESLGVYPSVSVYIDEVPLPFPVLTLRAAFDLERVEALKGPQGILFGQNATGGAINYIAAKPTRDLAYGADISYGRFNQIDGTAFISGPLGENVSARLAVAALDSDGWQRSITRPGDRNGAQKYIAGRLILDVNPTEALSLRFSVNAWQDKGEPQAAQLIAIRAQNPAAVQPATQAAPFATRTPRSADWTVTSPYAVFDSAFNVVPRVTPNLEPRSNRKFIQGALRADLDLGDVATLTSITSYLDFSQNLFSDKDGTAQAVANIGPSLADITSFNQELRLASQGSGPFRWLIGANYEDSETFEDQTLTFANGSSSAPGTLFINTTGSEVSQKIRNYAFFANGEYDFTDALTFKLGGRYTNSRNRADLCSTANGDGAVATLFNILPGAVFGVPAGSFTPISTGDCYPLNSQNVPGERFIDTLAEDNFSYRAGVDFKPNTDTLFYANISRGYKSGSYPTAAGSDFRSYAAVTQESVTSYEAGVKATLADRLIQFNAAAFYYDYKDKQIRGKIVDPVFDVLDILINVPKSRILGAEAEVTIRPARNLTLQGGLTYLDSKVQADNGARFVGPTAYGNSCGANLEAGGPGPAGPCDLTGSELPFTPKFSYSLNADYRFELSNASAFFLGAGVRGQSSSVATLDGREIEFRQLATDRNAPGIGKPFIIPSYTVVDARVGYEFGEGRYKVMLYGKNIFNEYYVTNANHYLDTTVRFVGMPATYGITLSLRN
jgi:outer membrane receptor protein involved in Fe transport